MLMPCPGWIKEMSLSYFEPTRWSLCSKKETFKEAGKQLLYLKGAVHRNIGWRSETRELHISPRDMTQMAAGMKMCDRHFSDITGRWMWEGTRTNVGTRSGKEEVEMKWNVRSPVLALVNKDAACTKTERASSWLTFDSVCVFVV